MLLGGLSLYDACSYTWTERNPLLLAGNNATRAVLGYSAAPLQILWNDNHCRTALPAMHHRVYRVGTPMALGDAGTNGSVAIRGSVRRKPCRAAPRFGRAADKLIFPFLCSRAALSISRYNATCAARRRARAKTLAFNLRAASYYRRRRRRPPMLARARDELLATAAGSLLGARAERHGRRRRHARAGRRVAERRERRRLACVVRDGGRLGSTCSRRRSSRSCRTATRTGTAGCPRR